MIVFVLIVICQSTRRIDDMLYGIVCCGYKNERKKKTAQNISIIWLKYNIMVTHVNKHC